MALQPVTLAVVNARVWTGDPRRPWADAVVVRGDRVAFVGSAAEARKLTRDAPDARIVDGAGQFLAPSTAVPPAGTLRTGGAADFVLVDRDLSRADAEQGADVRVVLVVRDGRVLDERVRDGGSVDDRAADHS